MYSSTVLDELSGLAPAHVGASADAEYLGTGASRIRLVIVGVVLSACVGGLATRAVQLQVFRGSALRAAADRNRSRTSILVPVRGTITDRHGAVIARSARAYAIGIAPSDVPRDDHRTEAIDAFAHALRTDATAVAETLGAYPATLMEPVVLRDALTYGEAIDAYVALRAFTGVQLLVREQREYHAADGDELEGMSHLLGYVARVSPSTYATLAAQRYRPADTIGTTGVESVYESILRGTPGLQSTAIDARGRVVATIAHEPAAAGQMIILTVDRAITDAATTALHAAFIASGARRGAAIALNPNDGAVLALVGLPGFSNTAIARGLTRAEYEVLERNPNHPLFPRAIAGTYPSGSTVKPFVAAAAIEEGIITRTTRITSVGGIRIGASFFPDWKAGGHGSVNIREALAQSVNTFFYVIGGGHPDSKFQIPNSKFPLGSDGLERALRAFGFGSPTGIDLPGEVSGLVPTPQWKRVHRDAPWYVGDTYHLAIGQGDFLITPLQLARATAALANGGTLVVPHVLLGTYGADGTVQRRDPPAGTPVAGIGRPAIDAVVAGMRAAVTEGSARALADLPFSVMGKTGTAQTVRTRPPHAWFTGFARRGDESMVVVVLVEDGGEGSVSAVPVARAMFAAWDAASSAAAQR